MTIQPVNHSALLLFPDGLGTCKSHRARVSGKLTAGLWLYCILLPDWILVN